VDVLSSRILVRPADLGRSRRFYRDVLGLAIYWEFGAAADPGVVFFLGPGLLEVSGRSAGPAGDSVMISLQVREFTPSRSGWPRPAFVFCAGLRLSPGD
jgi:catechol 2,3-dioxygenase-like lactoylglutathione lyase family enzyme